MSRIVSAAIKYGDVIFNLPKPNRHHHILQKMTLDFLLSKNNREQGFLTDEGIFVNRKEALKIVLENKQNYKNYMHLKLDCLAKICGKKEK